MIGLLRTIFIIVVVYYLLRFVNRVLVPYFRAVTEMNERQKNSPSSHPEKQPAKKRPKMPDGEYIDYKEIE
jgi:hypothetical protein